MTLTFRQRVSELATTTVARRLHPYELDDNFLHVLSSANYSFTADGTGAIPLSVEEVIQLIGVTPEQFGAVGDGTTNDKAALQAAYDAIKTSGGVLYLGKGKTYLCNTSMDLDGTGVEFRGAGTIKGAANIRPFEFDGAVNNTVRGIKILGTQGDSTVRHSLMSIVGCTNIRIEDNWFDDSSSSCIVLGSNNSRIRIVNNDMTDFYENGVDTVGSNNDDVLIADNFMSTSGVHPDAAVSRPIGISMEPQTDGYNADFVYHHNTITFDGLSTADMTVTHGITANKATSPATNFVLRRMVIDHNIIRGVGHGIRLLDTRYGTNDYGVNVTISGNQIERVRTHGILANGGEDATHRDVLNVFGNTVKGWSEATANLYDGIIADQNWYHPTFTGNIIGRREAESGAANGRYGINTGADCVVPRFSGNDITQAVTASYNDASGTGVLLDPDYEAAVSLTADNQVVTVGLLKMIRLSSNDATPANRTFTLTAGSYVGQMLVLTWDDTNAGQLADNTATPTVRLSAAWEPTEDDTLTLIWDGDEWMELCRSAN